MTEPAKMRVKEIRIFPIKSIRGMSLPSHRASAVGFEHDRIFMLQRVSDSKNMHVPHFPSMCLFTTEFAPNSEDPDKVLVRFGLDHVFDQPERKLSGNEVLEVPIRPDVAGLKSVEYKLHTSVARGYVMPDEICRWFSERFGFEVRLNYVGLNKREVLGNLNPNAPRTWVGDPDPKKEADKMMSPSGGGWLDGLKAGVGNVLGTVASYSGIDAYKGVDDGLTFTDLAAFLVVNYKSHVDVSGRVQTDIDVEKFRPNIVVDGDDEECGAWSEDYWGEIAIGPEERGTRIAFTSNCARCASVNVDYATGKMHEGPEGQLLKSMQGDRRVDPGFKYSPIFGRYGFLSQKNGQRPEKPITIRVGDEVQITKRNDKRTHFYWPNLGT